MDLFGTVWPHVPQGIELARRWRADWTAVSTPVLIRGAGEVLAHCGAIRCQLWLAGAPRDVTALHGVCVHPGRRGEGLGRRVLEAALDAVDGEPSVWPRTQILWSEKVDLYRKFGFEPLPESTFVGPLPEPVPTAARLLDLERPGDLAILRRALERRVPVSRIAAAGDDGWHFLIDLGLWPEARGGLIHLPDHGAVAVAEVEAGDDGTTLHLYDVVGPALPPPGALVGAAEAAFGAPPTAWRVYVCPDRLGAPLAPEPHPFEDVLMVRGEPLPGLDRARAFALTPLTRT